MTATVFATATGAARSRAAADDATDATYLQAAIEAVRADIAAVPGSGPIRGVFVLNAVTYAIRDNAGGTAGVLHKATADGWEAQTLNSVIDFDTGTAEFVEGETLTGGTSGATATIERVVITTDNDWAGGTATGYLVLSSVTGSFQSAETITSASGSATSTSADSVQALSAGGKYEFDIFNFGAASDTEFAYGCNGLDYGFEWTGSVFSFIRTGTTTDTPSHVRVHKNHLFWAIKSSLVFSSPGLPFDYIAGNGAGEIGLGATITGMLPLPGGVLNAYAQSKDFILYGVDSSDFELRLHAETQGGIEWSGAQMQTRSIVFDQLGLITKVPTQSYGDFTSMPFSKNIEPLLTLLKERVNAALAVQDKGHYRIFFSDKTAFTVGFNEKGLLGFFPQAYDHVVECAARGTDDSGSEILFFGSDDGFVYQMDKGTSFDGNPVVATLRLAFNNLGTPQNKKRYFVADIEMLAPSDLTLLVTPDFSYADPDNSTPRTETLSVSSGGGFWDFATWESFNWSEAAVATGKVHIDGSGTNISLLFYSSGTYVQPHTIEGYTLHYSVRGLTR